MGSLFIAIIPVGLLAIVGLVVVLNRRSARIARAQREAASQLRAQRAAERRVSPQPMPAVKRSRMATPVGARR